MIILAPTSSFKYFLRSNIILEYYFDIGIIFTPQNNGFIPKSSTINEKTAFIKQKTVKRCIVNYTKMLFRTKGMTCNHTLRSRESFQPYPFMDFVL